MRSSPDGASTRQPMRVLARTAQLDMSAYSARKPRILLVSVLVGFEGCGMAVRATGVFGCASVGGVYAL